jgi:hypothetical protein
MKGWLLLIVGSVLLLDPRCQGGCRTLATHLINHGLK